MELVVLHIILFLSFANSAFSPVGKVIGKLNEDIESLKPDQVMNKLNNLITDVSPCKCSSSGCECKFSFFIDSPENIQRGQISLNYDVANGLTTELKVGETVKSESTPVDASNQGTTLPPICVPIPQMPAIMFCVVLYDVRLDQDSGVHACVNLEGQLASTTLVAVSFDCVQVSQRGVETISPDVNRESLVVFKVGSNPSVTFFNKVSIGPLPNGDISNADSVRLYSANINPLGFLTKKMLRK